MSEYEPIKTKLCERKEKLVELLGRIEKSARRQFDKSFEEQAIQRENEEVLTSLDDSLHAELKQIERALTRIETGRYGVCESCGGDIGLNRLEALPHTAICLNCAA